jgi:hypothetical protein
MARKPWLATDLEDWNLDTKYIGPPGRGLSTRPTISSHKKMQSWKQGQEKETCPCPMRHEA